MMCILGTASKAAQALPKDQCRGTKDTEQPPAEAKPKSMQWSRAAVIWGLQIAQADECRVWISCQFGSSINSSTSLACG